MNATSGPSLGEGPLRLIAVLAGIGAITGALVWSGISGDGTSSARSFDGSPGAPPGAPCGTLQARVDATRTGGTLDLAGCTFAIASPVRIGRAMTLRGGTVTASTSALAITASDVTISGMTIVGPGYDRNRGHRAVQVRGASASAYLSGITIENNTIRNWDGDAIFAGFVEDFTFANNEISDVYYAGIEGGSVRHGRITDNHIANVAGTVNAYGIALSRSYGGGLSRNPRSSDVEVSHNTIEDVPYWEGLDTHGGERILFEDNVIRRARLGIAVGGCPDASGGDDVFAPLDITVSGNTIESGVSDGSEPTSGIYFGGAGTQPGAPTQLATGIISGNTLTGLGLQSSAEHAAMKLENTQGLRVVDNTIVEASPTAIHPYYNNFGFTIVGNVIRDAWSNTAGFAYGIYVHSDYNTGTIASNTFERGGKVARFVLTRNVVVANHPHNSVTVR